MAWMEMDWNLKKIANFFKFLMLRVPKILIKFIVVSHLWQNSFDIFLVALQKHFLYDLSLKVMILAQNWPETAKSWWHYPFKILGRRLHSPSLKDVAELISLIFQTFVCKFFSREPRLDVHLPSQIYRQM